MKATELIARLEAIVHKHGANVEAYTFNKTTGQAFPVKEVGHYPENNGVVYVEFTKSA
jgi:uncharacterized protein YkuJ